MSEESKIKWKKGDVNPETGLVFYRRRYKPTFLEIWYTPEKYEEVAKNLKNIYRDNYSREKYKDIYYRHKKKILETSKKCREELKKENPFKYLVRVTKNNSKSRGLEYNLDLEFLEELFDKQNGRCYYTNVPLIKSYGKGLPDQVSIDRLDNTKGYIKGNVALCCYSINLAKKDLDLEVFKNFINKVKNN